MRHRSAVVDWVSARPARSFFTPHDVPGSPRAVESSLSRLAAPSGPIQRVRQGLYWKKPASTRFGTARPDPTDSAFAAAGAGAGLAGVSAANALGLSTQVARQPTVAVVGRAPKGINGVRFTSRSNPHRISLSHLEVTVLEALRDFDDLSEIAWPSARSRVRRLIDDGRIDPKKIGAVAANERRSGLVELVADLSST